LDDTVIPYASHGGDKSWLSSQLQKMPYRFRPIIAKRYSQTFKNANRYQANVYLLDAADSIAKNPLVQNSLIIDDDEIVSKASAIAKRIDVECQTLVQALLIAGARLQSQYLPDSESKQDDDYSLARLKCSLWWRRALRKQQRRCIEETGRDLNLVNVNDGIYATNETVKLRKDQRARNRAMLEEVKAVNELGDEFTLQELSDKSVSNPELRRMELMTRIAGFEKYALENNHVGEFWTVTCPSKYHSAHSKSGRVNKKFKGLTPRDGQKYLAKTWARVRAEFARKEIKVYGFRVAEPQHDGTPHWHLLVFMSPGQSVQAREIYQAYALKEDGQERGALKYRFDFKVMNAGGAAGYIAKYIAKNIDGFGIEQDLFGNCAATSSQRVDAWASTWGIRQFQQIGGHSVTVWRELRRLEDAQIDENIKPIREAANSGDWCEYLKLMDVSKVTLSKCYHDKPGRYGEPVGDIIFGVMCGSIDYITRLHTWTISENKQGVSSDFQAHGASWSPVNNCTNQKTENEIDDSKIELERTGYSIEKGNFADYPHQNRGSVN
jgi:hypothetical protein